MENEMEYGIVIVFIGNSDRVITKYVKKETRDTDFEYLLEQCKKNKRSIFFHDTIINMSHVVRITKFPEVEEGD